MHEITSISSQSAMSDKNFTDTNRNITERLKSIDILRGIASFGVCLFHINYHVFDSAPWGIVKVFFIVIGFLGGFGIDVFFVISGFVIPYSLYKSNYSIINYPRFILKRVIRLDPPYFLSICLILLFYYLRAVRSDFEFTADPIQILLHVGYLCWIWGYNWLNPVYWSLSVEFFYYLVIGLFFPFIASKSYLKRNLFFLISIITLFFLGRLYSFTIGEKFTFFLLYSFLVGIILYQYKTGFIQSQKELFLQLGIVCLAKFIFLLSLRAEAQNNDFPAFLWYFAVFGVSTICLITVIGILQIKKGNKVLGFLGEISYSLYLTHYFISLYLTDFFYAKGLIVNSVTRVLLCLFILSVCILFAYFFYLLIEKPSKSWATKIIYKVNKGTELA